MNKEYKGFVNRAVYIPPYKIHLKTTSMKTPFFPSLRPCLAPMGSRSRAVTQSLKQVTLFQVEERLAAGLDGSLLQKSKEKDHSRERIFSLCRTFWCWIWQMLQANTSCREVVRQIQALFAAFSSLEIDEGTSAYCVARTKITDSLLEKAFQSSASAAQKQAPACCGLQGRPQKMVDGSFVRMTDTPENRKEYPPSQHQFPKPSFPMLKLVALFSAASGAILARATGTFEHSELRLLLGLRSMLQARDILIADRHYGCFMLVAWLLGQGVDLIARLTKNRRVDFRKATKRLGRQDGIFRWTKPDKPSPLLSGEEWAALPREMEVRILRVRVQKPGFRTREITLVTTLLDAPLYPAQEIFAAYSRRWRMEMCIDDLKTTLGMEMLNCRSPAMVQKELLVFLTAHNLVRWMMAQAARKHGADQERLSFKGTLDAFRQWTAAHVQIRGVRNGRKRIELWSKFLETLVADLVPLRPDRREPRAVKKRSKYPVLNKPRAQYVERLSRNKRRSAALAKKKGGLN
jgi:hypothetical protein